MKQTNDSTWTLYDSQNESVGTVMFGDEKLILETSVNGANPVKSLSNLSTFAHSEMVQNPEILALFVGGAITAQKRVAQAAAGAKVLRKEIDEGMNKLSELERRFGTTVCKDCIAQSINEAFLNEAPKVRAKIQNYRIEANKTGLDKYIKDANGLALSFDSMVIEGARKGVKSSERNFSSVFGPHQFDLFDFEARKVSAKGVNGIKKELENWPIDRYPASPYRTFILLLFLDYK